MRATIVGLLWVVAGLLGLLGCQKAEPPPSRAAPGGAATPATAPGPGPPAGAAQASNRVVRTASLELVVSDVPAARNQVLEVVGRRGGLVKNAELSQSGEEAVEQAHLSVRVPAPRFDETLQALAALAVRVANERTSSEDVTEAHVDLSARLAAKRKIEARYLALLERAQNVKEVLEVERELGNLRVEAEQLESRKTLLESQAAFATIDVVLQRERGRVTASLGAVGSSGRRDVQPGQHPEGWASARSADQ